MSGVIEVSAKKNENEATIQYDFGEDLAAMVEKFTEPVVFTQARAQMKIVLQAAMRRRLEAGQPCDDLAEVWKPGVQMERIVDPFAAAKALFATKSDDEKRAFLEELQNA
jgi:hypothetical protein